MRDIGARPGIAHDPVEPTGATAAALTREPDATSAIARRRQLRTPATDAKQQARGHDANEAAVPIEPGSAATRRAARAIKRLQQISYSRSGESLQR